MAWLLDCGMGKESLKTQRSEQHCVIITKGRAQKGQGRQGSTHQTGKGRNNEKDIWMELKTTPTAGETRRRAGIQRCE